METLYGDAGCSVEKGKRKVLHVWAGWAGKHAALAREYEVEEIRLESSSLKGRRSVDFLLEFPELRGVSADVWPPIGLSALGRLSRLETLSLSFGMSWRTCDQLAAVDLSGLSELRRADVMLCPALGSVLEWRLGAWAITSGCRSAMPWP